MRTRRLAEVVALSLLVLGIETAYAAPMRASSSLRASLCCATHCHHARSPRAANRCCRIVIGEPALATLSLSPLIEPVATLAASVAGMDVECIAPCRLIPVIAEPALARAAPLFILTRSLRC
jgi:hypothetical protein